MFETVKKSLTLRQRAESAASNVHALMVAAEQAVTSALGGEHAQRKVGAGEKFWQFRPYMTGDRPQDIDWRQSAKADDVHIRQKEWQTPQTTILWCARNPGMNFTSDDALPSKAEAAKILTLALAILVTRAGDQAGLFGAGRAGRSENTLQTMAAMLGEKPDTRLPLPDIAHFTASRNSTLIQVGDFLEPLEVIDPVFKNLALQSRNGLVIQVLDPAEIDLPFTGRVLFESPENDTRQLVNHVSSVQDAYQARIRDHLRGVETITRECHWAYILHRTDVPIKDTLATIWGMISYHEAGPR